MMQKMHSKNEGEPKAAAQKGPRGLCWRGNPARVSPAWGDPAGSSAAPTPAQPVLQIKVQLQPVCSSWHPVADHLCCGFALGIDSC